MAILTTPFKALCLNLWPRGHEFNNFDKGFHEHHYLAFHFSPTTEKIFYKFNAYILYGPF